MVRRVVITGAAGNIGAKLRAHLTARGGFDLTLLDIDPRGDPLIQQADLSQPARAWSDRFEGAEVIVHLAANGNSAAGWDALTRANVDSVLNVYLAAAQHRAPRVVCASSVWAMAGRRDDHARLTADDPDPGGNAYGATKLFAERTARAFWRSHGTTSLLLRLGGCLPGDNPPVWATDPWQGQCWLSNRDACLGLELAMTAPAQGVSVVNLMSENPGSRWSLDEARTVLGFEPQDRGPDLPPPHLTGGRETAQGAAAGTGSVRGAVRRILRRLAR